MIWAQPDAQSEILLLRNRVKDLEEQVERDRSEYRAACEELAEELENLTERVEALTERVDGTGLV